MEGSKAVQVRRVGTITFGAMLILFGLLFLGHMFIDNLTYIWIFRLWPVIFISLGAEVLVSSLQKSGRIVYDGVAMLLMAFLTVFAMGMAVADMVIQYEAGRYL